MQKTNHGFPKNKYNKHTWIAGEPEIGERVWIGAFCLIDATYAPLKIGKGTDISSGVQILTHSTVKRSISERMYNDVESAPTEIGDFCFIGTHATILMGVKIGHHSAIAAGAVVPQFMKIPPYSLVAGVPAKIVGSTKRFLRGVDKESISVTIPAFNEEKNIEKIIKEAIEEVSKLTKDYEIVVVDDGSEDNTGKIADKLSKRNKRIKVVHHKKNKGFTGAMKSCLYNATKSLVFLAPADGQFNLKQLDGFVNAIRGYDMVVGYKVKNTDNLFRKISTWAIYTLYQVLFEVPLRSVSGVFMWRKRVIDSIQIESSDRGAMFLYELFYKAISKRYTYVEIPIKWRSRRAGKAKGRGVQNIIKTLEGMFSLWYKLRFLKK